MTEKGSAQKLAELMIQRQAAKDGVKLSEKFWNERDWKPKYRYQIIMAQSLLKNYSYEAIMKALNTFSGKKILSLRAPWLDELIEKEQKAINLTKELQKVMIKNQEEKTEINTSETKTFAKPKNNDLFDKLE